ncbi:MAG: methylated-DNA-[protein]-cysteine S-methyltransferase [Clostridiales bacterium]|jgi:methylated-DNA-[protein]-cysteine S-methyltransferase|nr:methylated-DNA-[protein]-cysteine S-methyltransferase [Clostridiales bacterium]MDK2934633.1 methylated-DNA-[protein]-cysteine S-methyltransferase [Clostridiales bacterium]
MSVAYYSQYCSPLGIIYIAASDKGICKIVLPGQSEQELVIWLQKNFSKFVQKETDIIKQTASELAEYFNQQRTDFTIPLHLIGTAFQKKVWKELMKIPYGSTVSYGYIASKIGNPKACRAVGGANNKNPIPIVIPCHRIVGSTGKLVGYGGGLDLKEKLLKIENIKDFKK